MAETKEGPESAEGKTSAKQKAKAEQPKITQEARMWAMLCHLLGLFTCFIGPLIIWLIKKDEDPFIDNQGKEALNFQITVAIAWIVSAVLMIICLGVILGIVVFIADLVFSIIASVKANSGQAYRYPVSIRFIK